jgi:hypothetical protein
MRALAYAGSLTRDILCVPSVFRRHVQARVEEHGLDGAGVCPSAECQSEPWGRAEIINQNVLAVVQQHPVN